MPNLEALELTRSQLSPAQLRRFQAAVASVIDPTYDHVLVYTFPPGAVPRREAWGVEEAAPTDIL